MIYNSLKSLIGKTPMLRLKSGIIAKLECFNPTGSVKDRTAFAMLERAEKEGKLKAGSTVIEPTSGNTGIALGALCAERGYRLILTMPETMSEERRALLKAYGAELVLTSGKEGMSGAVKKAEELSKEISGSLVLGQFENPANPLVHKETTGREIWEDTKGNCDIFVCGVGTGGTISGAGEYLKSKNPNIKIIAVEPLESPVISGGKAGAHGIQGIGAGFIPKVLNQNIFSEVITVSTENAKQSAKAVALSDGILVGISSGATLFVANEIATRPENIGKTIVALLPDSGERYLSVLN
ncbi:MAG: cysteine synthase A [Firmicutes bacterium]|nr:cysteine synthase A [Bacillota bacterium]